MPCVVRSSNLVQELGMVSNVFSDKTGTLTRNEMRFVKFIVDGKLFDLDLSSVPTEDMSNSGGKKSTANEKNLPSNSAQSDVTALLATAEGKKSKVSYDSAHFCVSFILNLNLKLCFCSFLCLIHIELKS